jgi:protein-S-isoprenylcysteine O-methyltransferase Ste14
VLAVGALAVPPLARRLGDNWSISLEIRTQHKLIDHGVYARVRRPMYTSTFLQAIAQALLLPNWVAGPSCLLAFILMFALRVALRVSTEERMMLKQFGEDYALYMGRSKRLVPGVW